MRKPLGLTHPEFDQNKSSTHAQKRNILFIQLIHEFHSVSTFLERDNFPCILCSHTLQEALSDYMLI